MAEKATKSLLPSKVYKKEYEICGYHETCITRRCQRNRMTSGIFSRNGKVSLLLLKGMNYINPHSNLNIDNRPLSV